MKKWHMEGIVSVVNPGGTKLEIPDPTRMTWPLTYADRIKKDCILVRFGRWLFERFMALL